MPHYYTIKSVLKKPIKMPALVAYIKFFLLFMSVHLFCKFKFTYLLKVSLPSWILYLFILSWPCLSLSFFPLFLWLSRLSYYVSSWLTLVGCQLDTHGEKKAQLRIAFIRLTHGHVCGHFLNC